MALNMSSEEYDFIIVGAGPAGCALASTLAASHTAPKVLLVEAGDDNQDKNLRIDANKYVQHKNPAQAWGYTSSPEPGLSDRVLELARGKGLGGSSAVNFTVWSEGPRDDMDRMVEYTGDAAWAWDKVKDRYKRLTAHNMDIHQDYKPYIQPDSADVGNLGPLRIGYPAEFDHEIAGLVDVFLDNGVPIRKSANNGDLLGMAIYPVTSDGGRRSTSADLLQSAPQNLVILTNCTVYRVLFKGTTATGIITQDGQTLLAKKEVILSAGTMASPKILMHSGIGPSDQLAAFGIPVLYANPNVGQNFQDHIGVVLRWQRAEHTSVKPAYFRDKEAQNAALDQWQQSGTGPLASIGCTLALGFFKSDATLSSSEFSKLPIQEQDHMTAPTIPMYEVALGATAPEYYIDPDNAPAIATAFVILHNLQSRGSCILQSSDPAIPLVFNTGFLSHPFDQRLAIDSMKDIMAIMQSEAFQKDHVQTVEGPKSMSEEDILDFWRKNASTTWHMSSTCSMAGVKDKEGNKKSGVVDPNFCVHGTKGLRVVDNSIFPFIPSAHIQAHAYQVGLIAAEKIVMEYKLDFS